MDFGADTDLDCIGGKSDKVFCGGGAGEEGVSVVKVGFLDSELCQNDQGISSLLNSSFGPIADLLMNSICIIRETPLFCLISGCGFVLFCQEENVSALKYYIPKSKERKVEV